MFKRYCLFFLYCLLLTACTPTSEINVLGYLLSEQLGTISDTVGEDEYGALTGIVLHDESPIPNITVLVAGRTGTPYSTQTDADGRYQIDNIPIGQYVPAAVGPGFDEVAAEGSFGIPRLVTIEANQTAVAQPLYLTKHQAVLLPKPLAQSIRLTQTNAYTSSAAFSTGLSGPGDCVPI